MDRAIVIENLTKAYKNGRGIFDINLEIEHGEIFGFLGPNGAGKTTAMKIMTGLMKPDSGDVRINGCSVLKDYENAMRSVGCIVENFTPYPYLTAYENMKLAARLHGTQDGRIDECLGVAGILKHKKEKTKGLSLGMKQRLGIAMSILHEPDIIIWDEPLNGLDVEGMFEMRNLILSLARDKGTTFFISSHLIHDIELTCTKIGILFAGKIISVDWTENILKNFSSLENYYLSEVDVSEKP